MRMLEHVSVTFGKIKHVSCSGWWCRPGALGGCGVSWWAMVVEALWCQLRLMVSALVTRAKLRTSVVDGVGRSTSDPLYSHPKMFVRVDHRDRTQPQQSSFMDATSLVCGSRQWSREPGGDHSVAIMFGSVLPLCGAPFGAA